MICLPEDTRVVARGSPLRRRRLQAIPFRVHGFNVRVASWERMRSGLRGMAASLVVASAGAEWTEMSWPVSCSSRAICSGGALREPLLDSDGTSDASPQIGAGGHRKLQRWTGRDVAA